MPKSKISDKRNLLVYHYRHMSEFNGDCFFLAVYLLMCWLFQAINTSHGLPCRDENVESDGKLDFSIMYILDLILITMFSTANTELYCKFGIPFVMGTTGGDRELMYKTVEDSNVYALISPQMGKQVF